MSAHETVDDDDPYLAHFHRDPLPDAGVLLVLLSEQAAESTSSLLAQAVAWIEAAKRPVEVRVAALDSRSERLGEVLARALEGTSQPLVLVTTALEAPTGAHLEPLFKSIDLCDHVTGRRPASTVGRILRAIGSLPRRLVFAVPILDVDSPLSLHRIQALRAIPLQSASSFVRHEILAKATFLGHLLNEVDVPAIRGWTMGRGWWSDLGTILKNPAFRPDPSVLASVPAEDSQSQIERADGPRGQDQDGLEHVVLKQGGAVEKNEAQSVD
jgi:hypothetical protein